MFHNRFLSHLQDHRGVNFKGKNHHQRTAFAAVAVSYNNIGFVTTSVEWREYPGLVR